MQKIQKNYPRQDIKTGKTPRCGKVRKPKKSGCFPTSKGATGRRPHGFKAAKLYIKRIGFLTPKSIPRGPQSPKMYPK